MDCEKALKQYFQLSVFDQILMLLDKEDEIGEYLFKKYWQSWVNNYYLSEIINKIQWRKWNVKACSYTPSKSNIWLIFRKAFHNLNKLL